MNEIYVRNTIIDFYENGKSKDEIVDFFYNNNGVFLWGEIERDKISRKVNSVIDDYNNPKFSISWKPVIMVVIIIILGILVIL